MNKTSDKEKKNTAMLISALESTSSYDAFLEENEDDLGLDKFKFALRKFIAQSEMEMAEIIAGSHLDRTYAYQLFNGTRNPSRDKIIQLIFALKLNLEDANYLLQCAGKQPLYAKVKRDATIIYALVHHFPLQQADELLMKHDLLPLLSKIK